VRADVRTAYLAYSPVEALRCLALIEVNKFGDDSVTKVERGIQCQRSQRVRHDRRLRRGEQRDNRSRMRAVHDVRTAPFHSLAAEIITDVEPRDIGKYWSSLRVLTVA